MNKLEDVGHSQVVDSHTHWSPGGQCVTLPPPYMCVCGGGGGELQACTATTLT